mmetsp:Transcript_7631/g.15924  ORF Transcript_7631/g.15924 Transcript_7631/m.15924 type:complete len:89 (-) Transcript_7631:2090-2356(-)
MAGPQDLKAKEANADPGAATTEALTPTTLMLPDVTWLIPLMLLTDETTALLSVAELAIWPCKAPAETLLGKSTVATTITEPCDNTTVT